MSRHGVTGRIGTAAGAVAALFFALAPIAAAADSDAPTDGATDSRDGTPSYIVPTDVYCTTYYPSAIPSGIDAGSGTAGSGVVATATATAVGAGEIAPDPSTADLNDSEVPTATDLPTDTGTPTDLPTDTGTPTDLPTDTGTPTVLPSGPYTACVAAEHADRDSGGGSVHKSRSADPLSNSGDDTLGLAVIGVGLLGLGVTLSVIGGRRRAKRSH